MRGKRYETEKNIWGGDRKSDDVKKSSGRDCHLKEAPYRTGVRLASEYGISERQIRYEESFAKAVDILPKEIKDNVLSGESKLAKTDAEIIVKMPTLSQKKFLKEVEKGTPIKEAVKKVDPELKRKERDDFVRAEMQRKQEMMFTLFMKNA